MGIARSSNILGKITILFVICCCSLPAKAKYGGGTGEPNDPYLIFDANQMNAIGADSNDWDKHFKLMADIDLAPFTGTSFNIIGNWPDPFTGVFGGNGHTISNFTYSSTGRGRIGLFGYVDEPNAEIKNLRLIDPNVDAGTGYYIGSLVGFLSNGTISKCYIEGGSVSGASRVGGLVGYNEFMQTPIPPRPPPQPPPPPPQSPQTNWNNSQVAELKLGDGTTTFQLKNGVIIMGGYAGLGETDSKSRIIDKSYVTGSVTGTTDVGGLGGFNDRSAIINCYSTASVSGNHCVGGLVGQNDWDETSPIRFCYSTASVTGTGLWFDWLAGTSGSEFGGAGAISNGYSLGGVSGDRGGGGLGGYNCRSTIINCYSTGSVSGEQFVGGLVGMNGSGFGGAGAISNCYSLSDVSGDWGVGGLVGYNWDWGGIITDCYATGDVMGNSEVGGLVGGNWWGTIANCFTRGNVSGDIKVGGLMGFNYEGRIAICYSTGSVYGSGGSRGGALAGGLVGGNNGGTIFICYSTGTVTGTGWDVGGLVGSHSGTITNCYSTGGVSGGSSVGGLVGRNDGYGSVGEISNSYATGSVTGNDEVGGLVGYNWFGTISNCYSIGSVSGPGRGVGGLVEKKRDGEIVDSFWDIETSGQTTSVGGTGLSTTEMQMSSTFIDAGWDFNTPVWTIDEGVNYPRLWWELVPVLHPEPKVTLGTANTITWEPVPDANDYYAECAEDANFTSIVYNSGWITETSCEFTGLELGKHYWYSIKARNSAGTETNWSNVESSLQGTLTDAVETTLGPESLKNENMKNSLLNKIDEALKMIEEANYTVAFNKLQNDILQKTNGCAETGRPDKNDWIITCEQQCRIYPLIIETIEHVKGLME